MTPTKPTTTKPKTRLILIFVVLVGLILTGIFYKTLYGLVFQSSQIALIQTDKPLEVSCVSDLGQFNANHQCGNGLVKDINYSCLSTGKNYAKTAKPSTCLDPVAELAEAQKACGVTCPQSSPSPVPSPSPLPSTSTPYPSPSVISSAPFYTVTNHANPIKITCLQGDINCGFSEAVMFKNTSSYDLYYTKGWGTKGLTFSGNHTGLTDQTTTYDPIITYPGDTHSILIVAKVKPDMGPGTYSYNYYLSGQRCNQIGSNLDCVYDGTATFTINLRVLPYTPPPSFSPSPTPYASSAPTAIPTPTTVAIPTKTPTPVPSTKAPTNNSNSSCYNSCRQQKGSWYSCIRSCYLR